MNIRIAPEMLEKGYMVIHFPVSLKKLMRSHIESYIHKVSPGFKDLTEAVMHLSDEHFVEVLGNKPFRMFPDSVAHEIAKWAEACAPSFGAVQSGINYVNQAELEGNKALHPHSYDTFWRCVRPGKGDVGAAHADFQFWELARGTTEEPGLPFSYDERWKIWTPLLNCTNDNSLQLIPGSHLEELPITIRKTKFGLRPDIETSWLEANEKRFMCPLTSFEDTAILFHDKVVHRGPRNNTAQLRISGELTILLQLANREIPFMDREKSGMLIGKNS